MFHSEGAALCQSAGQLLFNYSKELTPLKSSGLLNPEKTVIYRMEKKKCNVLVPQDLIEHNG